MHVMYLHMCLPGSIKGIACALTTYKIESFATTPVNYYDKRSPFILRNKFCKELPISQSQSSGKVSFLTSVELTIPI